MTFFIQELDFSFELYDVEDGKWGALHENNSWDGLIQDVISE